jgi:hypothetical protein
MTEKLLNSEYEYNHSGAGEGQVTFSYWERLKTRESVSVLLLMRIADVRSKYVMFLFVFSIYFVYKMWACFFIIISVTSC